MRIYNICEWLCHSIHTNIQQKRHIFTCGALPQTCTRTHTHTHWQWYTLCTQTLTHLLLFGICHSRCSFSLVHLSFFYVAISFSYGSMIMDETDLKNDENQDWKPLRTQHINHTRRSWNELTDCSAWRKREAIVHTAIDDKKKKRQKNKVQLKSTGS